MRHDTTARRRSASRSQRATFATAAGMLLALAVPAGAWAATDPDSAAGDSLIIEVTVPGRAASGDGASGGTGSSGSGSAGSGSTGSGDEAAGSELAGTGGDASALWSVGAAAIGALAVGGAVIASRRRDASRSR